MTRPPWTTAAGFLRITTSLVGSPSNATRSAYFPGASVPRSFDRPRRSAALRVAATIAYIGVMPNWTISSNSWAFWPCGVTALSVPKAIFTPAACALRNDCCIIGQTASPLAIE